MHEHYMQYTPTLFDFVDFKSSIQSNDEVVEPSDGISDSGHVWVMLARVCFEKMTRMHGSVTS